MSNRWGIPKEVEQLVLKRDLNCVYCGILFLENAPIRRTRKTWEHIINDIRINGLENIAICCASCNASKGNKLLVHWLESKYCLNKNITPGSVAPVVRDYLAKINFEK